MSQARTVLVTGGAGYIGSLLTGLLIARGHSVRGADCLFFGGEPLLPYFTHPGFRFYRIDVCTDPLDELLEGVEVVYHLAALVGFPACQRAGEAAATRINVGGTRRVWDAAAGRGAERFILASTYSSYGVAANGTPVTEESPLHPQSLYARTKIAAERVVLDSLTESRVVGVVARFATLFGISPRTRFDLMVNQFVLEAFRDRRLVVYEQDFNRSFVHVRDVAEALLLLLEAPADLVRGEIFNVGGDDGNYSKQQIIELICQHLPDVAVEYRDLTFSGDMRDIRVSFEKIRSRLGFKPALTLDNGIVEVLTALRSGLIHDPDSNQHRNSPSIVQ